MTIDLTEQQQQTLASQPGELHHVRNAQTNESFVLLRSDVYERLRGLLETEDLTADEKIWLLGESGRRAGWDDPLMDAYDNYEENYQKLCQ